MSSARRRARIAALKALFEYDAAGHDPIATLGRHEEEEVQPEEVSAYGCHLVQGVMDHLGEIDALIQQAAPTWPLSQMAHVDKSILRLAIFEVLLDNRVPVKAAINEAIELAKLFGGDNSRKFVNGVLGTVVAQKPDVPRREANRPPEPEEADHAGQ